jgi:tetratricopeptide (TPR) repeat protein
MLLALAHRLLLVLGLFIAVCLLLVATANGVFGQPPAEKLAQSWQQGHAFYERNESALSLALRVVGGIGSFLAAVFTLYKAWYYAERNLPRRLEKMAKGHGLEVRKLRYDLVPQLVDSAGLSFLPEPVVATPYRFGFLSYFSRDPYRRNEEILRSNHDALPEIVAALKSQAEARAAELATIRVLDGLRLARRAEDTGDAFARHALNNAALAAFRSAIDVMPGDLDAHQLAARQLKILGRRDEALDQLERMVQEAAGRHDFLRKARALRLQAEVLIAKGRPGDLAEARQRLRDAEVDIGLATSPTHEAAIPVEAALIAETLYRVYVERRQPRLAGGQYAKAMALINTLPLGPKCEARRRLFELSMALSAALRDGEDTGVSETDDASQSEDEAAELEDLLQDA